MLFLFPLFSTESALGCFLVLFLSVTIFQSGHMLYIRNCRSMKLTKLYSVSSACSDEDTINTDSARVRPCVKRSGTHKSPKRARCRVTQALRVSSVGVAPLKTKKYAACFSHAAKRLSVAKSPALRLSYQKAHAKRVKRLTMRANVQSACVSVLNTGKSIPLNRFIDGICSNCLFSYYCDDKDKQCLSVNI